MNYVQKVLHSAIGEDMINMLSTMEKCDDFVWLEQHGYYVRKQWGGNLTKKGEAFIAKQNEVIEKMFARSQSQMECPKFKDMQRKLLQYQKELEEGSILDGLTEDEAFAVRYLTKTY